MIPRCQDPARPVRCFTPHSAEARGSGTSAWLTPSQTEATAPPAARTTSPSTRLAGHLRLRPRAYSHVASGSCCVTATRTARSTRCSLRWSPRVCASICLRAKARDHDGIAAAGSDRLLGRHPSRAARGARRHGPPRGAGRLERLATLREGELRRGRVQRGHRAPRGPGRLSSSTSWRASCGRTARWC